ncbi:hypothetical protein MUN74_14735 [Agromyces endophyticus]|uniref:hypothetical protein n=1 Tax=Agromyces sp. H17E-10 TaxID=2932244 RepID=UPI001FD26392|nr:hypothetical protein [Agromyces sp. H17E-10]UOQ88517.1 hypothetical protein MUN74_14735 [Agromyces sp. H17E-10]
MSDEYRTGPDGPDDVPHDDRPVFGARRRRVLRITVLVALGALVLPLVLSLVGQAQSAAARACAVYVQRFDAEALDSQVSLELFGPGGPGWQCSAVAPGGIVTPVANLGLLPTAPAPIGPGERGT